MSKSERKRIEQRAQQRDYELKHNKDLTPAQRQKLQKESIQGHQTAREKLAQERQAEEQQARDRVAQQMARIRRQQGDQKET